MKFSKSQELVRWKTQGVNSCPLLFSKSKSSAIHKGANVWRLSHSSKVRVNRNNVNRNNLIVIQELIIFKAVERVDALFISEVGMRWFMRCCRRLLPWVAHRSEIWCLLRWCKRYDLVSHHVMRRGGCLSGLWVISLIHHLC